MKFHLIIVNPAKRELEKFRGNISKYNSLSDGAYKVTVNTVKYAKFADISKRENGTHSSKLYL